MIYQLPNGKCIEMSIDQYLKMTDEELKNLVAYNFGEEFNDPFIHSVLRHGPAREDQDDTDDEDLIEDEFLDLTDIHPEDKIFDDDYIDYDNLEQ